MYKLYDFLNKCAFSILLKISMSDNCLMLWGKLFQSLCAAAEKALVDVLLGQNRIMSLLPEEMIWQDWINKEGLIHGWLWRSIVGSWTQWQYVPEFWANEVPGDRVQFHLFVSDLWLCDRLYFVWVEVALGPLSLLHSKVNYNSQESLWQVIEL